MANLPVPNPIPNEAVVAYQYEVDPQDPLVNDGDISNTVTTQVNTADLDLRKSTDLDFAKVGDTLTYTIVITNSGNVTANNVTFTDTIPNDTTFVANSVTENGVTLPGENPSSGVLLMAIPPNGVTTVTFQVIVDTIPSPNPIPNSADAAWVYTSDPANPNGQSGRDTSNTVSTQVNQASISPDDGGLVKSVDPEFAKVGDTLTYSVILTNTGNVTANNVFLFDTIPNDTTFITNSVTVDGAVQVGVNPETGVSIGNIAPSQTVTVTFRVTVDTIPSPNPIPNSADVAYDYTVDPSIPNGESERNTSNQVDTQVNQATISPDDGGLVKSVNPEFADVGNTLTYTIILINTGNVDANNVALFDTIPNDTTFVANSVTVDGITQGGANPETGVVIGTISPNQTVTVTFAVTVDTIPSPNPIPNTADVAYDYTVDPSVPNGESERNSTNEVDTQVNTANISNGDGGLVKSVNPEFAMIGDTITYTIVLTNTGNVTANNVVFSDTIPNDTTFVGNSVTVDGVTQPAVNPQTGVAIGTIAPNQTVTVTFQVTIDTIPSPNPILNVGDVAYDYTVDPSVPNGASERNSTNEVDTQVNEAIISPFVKSVNPEFATVGETLTYTLTVTNIGNTDANNVVLTDTIPNDTTFVPNSVTINGLTQGGANPETGILIGTVIPNQTMTVTFQVTVDTLPSPNPIPNTAVIDYDYTVDPSVPNGESKSEVSNEASTQVNIAKIDNSDGGFIKSVTPEFADVGDTITYTLVLTNTGNVAANNVVLVDTIPNGTTFVGSSVTVDGVNQPALNPESGIPLGTINPAQAVTVTFQVTVDEIPSPNPIPNTGTVDFTFTVDPSIPDGATGGGNSNTVETQVNNASISPDDGGFVKSVDPEFAKVGDTLTYTLVLTNTGNVDATNVVFTDTIPTDTTFVADSVTLNGSTQIGANPETGIAVGTIAPNQVVTITFQVTVDTIPSPNPITNEGIVNYTYTVDPRFPDGASDEQISNEVDTQVSEANISPDDGGFVKIVSTEFADVGDTITYTLILTNTGNVDANNVVLSDTIPNDTTFVTDSVTVDGVTQPGVNPQTGVNIGTISPNQTVTVTFQVVADTIPSPNPILNTADVAYTFTVDPSVPNGESERNTSNEVETQINTARIDNSDGGFVKIVDPEFATVGDTFTYTIVANNTGNVDANNVVITDTIPNDTTFVTNSVTVDGVIQPGINPESGIPIGTIAPGQAVTVTFQVVVDTIPSPDPVPNIASVEFTYTVDPSVPDGVMGGGNTNEVETDVNIAIVNTSKTVDTEFADIGDTITFTITLNNVGNVDAIDVIVTDTIPDGTSFVNDSVTVNGSTVIGVDPEIGIDIGTITPGETVTITFQVVVESIPSPNPVNNIANTNYSYLNNPDDPNSRIDDSSTGESPFIQINTADLIGSTKDDNPDVVAPGDTITYTIAIPNTGNVDAENVVLTDPIPPGTNFVSGSVTINGVVSGVSNPEDGISLGAIAPGTTTTVTFQVVYIETPPPVNPIPNTATIDYEYTVDPNEPSKTDSTDTNTTETEVQYADIDARKEANKSIAEPGEVITYSVTLTNSGNVTATNVIFTDSLPAESLFIDDSVEIDGVDQPGADIEAGVNVGEIAPGETKVITYQVRVTSVPPNNQLINRGTVTFDFLSGSREVEAQVEVEEVTIVTFRTPTVNTFNNCNRCSSSVSSDCECLDKCMLKECDNSTFQYRISGLCSDLEKVEINEVIQTNKIWTQSLISSILEIRDHDCRIDTIEDVNVSCNIIRKKVISTPGDGGIENLESMSLTGSKLIIEGELCIDLTIVCGNQVFKKAFVPIFSGMIVVDNIEGCDYEVRCCIEDLTISDICKNVIQTQTLILLYAIPVACDLEDACICAQEEFVTNDSTGCNVNTFITDGENSWKEFNIQNLYDVGSEIGSLSSINGSINILNSKVIETPVSIRENNEGKTLTGKKLVIELILDLRVMYTPNCSSGGLMMANIKVPYSVYLVVPDDTKLVTKFDVKWCIEDLFAYKADCTKIFTNSTIIIKANPKVTPLCRR